MNTKVLSKGSGIMVIASSVRDVRRKKSVYISNLSVNMQASLPTEIHFSKSYEQMSKVQVLTSFHLNSTFNEYFQLYGI